MRIAGLDVGRRFQSLRVAYMVVTSRAEHVVRHEREVQSLLKQVLPDGQVEVAICLLTTLREHIWTDEVGIELHTGCWAECEIIYPRSRVARILGIATTLIIGRKLIVEHAAVECHTPPTSVASLQAGLHAIGSVTTCIDKRVERHTWLICHTDKVVGTTTMS